MVVKMTQNEIKERIAKIRANARDYEYEAAHSDEDELRTDFIRYVAEYGPQYLATMAEEILTTDEIEFKRYCA